LPIVAEKMHGKLASVFFLLIYLSGFSSLSLLCHGSPIR
jgi:hypothetical protein